MEENPIIVVIRNIICFTPQIFATRILGMIFDILVDSITGIIAFVPFYFLWNWLMPKYFNLPLLEFWDMVGFICIAFIVIEFISGIVKPPKITISQE